MKRKIENIDQFKEKENFKIPDNYFEDFALEMQHTVGNLSKNDSGISKLLHLFQLRLSIPTACAILLVVTISLLNKQEKDSVKLTYADATAYLLDEVERLDEEEIYELAISTSKIEESDDHKKILIDYLIEEEQINLNDINYSIN